MVSQHHCASMHVEFDVGKNRSRGLYPFRGRCQATSHCMRLSQSVDEDFIEERPFQRHIYRRGASQRVQAPSHCNLSNGERERIAS